MVKLLFSLCSESYFNETWHPIGIFYGQSIEIIRNVVTSRIIQGFYDLESEAAVFFKILVSSYHGPTSITSTVLFEHIYLEIAF